MAAFSTIALAVGAAAAVGSAGYSVHAGERSNSLQRQGRRKQEAAQADALRVQLLQRQRAELAAANAAKPSPTASLDEPTAGVSTDLTGGVERDRLRLARMNRLGG
jgi:ABC-type branched-subunit amino acid transport system ATPase component